MLITDTIRERPTTDPAVYAFEIGGEVASADMEAMADHMNAAFDTHERVSMLLIFRDYAGSETGAGTDWSSIRSRFRSLRKVEKYAVVGAPRAASRMIETMGALIPVEARTFEAAQEDEAWSFVGARPA